MTHIEDISEWVDSAGFTTIPPLVNLIGNTLQQYWKDLNAMSSIFEIVGRMTDITRTVLSASLVREYIQSLVKDGQIIRLNLFYCYVHITKLWSLGSSRSIERSVTARQKHLHLP